MRITLETGDCAYSNLPIEEYETIICDKLIERAKEEGTLKLLVHIDYDFIGCSPDETMYFGDDYNDIEAIKLCGIGIAVSNAIDEVKNVADYINYWNL